MIGFGIGAGSAVDGYITGQELEMKRKTRAQQIKESQARTQAMQHRDQRVQEQFDMQMQALQKLQADSIKSRVYDSLNQFAKMGTGDVAPLNRVLQTDAEASNAIFGFSKVRRPVYDPEGHIPDVQMVKEYMKQQGYDFENTDPAKVEKDVQEVIKNPNMVIADDKVLMRADDLIKQTGAFDYMDSDARHNLLAAEAGLNGLITQKVPASDAPMTETQKYKEWLQARNLPDTNDNWTLFKKGDLPHEGGSSVTTGSQKAIAANSTMIDMAKKYGIDVEKPIYPQFSKLPVEAKSRLKSTVQGYIKDGSIKGPTPEDEAHIQAALSAIGAGDFDKEKMKQMLKDLPGASGFYDRFITGIEKWITANKDTDAMRDYKQVFAIMAKGSQGDRLSAKELSMLQDAYSSLYHSDAAVARDIANMFTQIGSPISSFTKKYPIAGQLMYGNFNDAINFFEQAKDGKTPEPVKKDSKYVSFEDFKGAE